MKFNFNIFSENRHNGKIGSAQHGMHENNSEIVSIFENDGNHFPDCEDKRTLEKFSSWNRYKIDNRFRPGLSPI